MDADARALVRRLAADPGDSAAGAALVRLLERRGEPGPGELPRELVPGSAALVVRRGSPRPLFAWRPPFERAIGRVGRVGALAADRLSAEVSVSEVGRFHAGAASLFSLPGVVVEEKTLESAWQPAREGRSLAALARLAPLAREEEPGPLGADGLTLVQRALLAAVPHDQGAPLGEVARAAGFVVENNRSVEGAYSVLHELARDNPRARPPVVAIETPLLLPGERARGSVDTGAWEIADLWVARLPEAEAVPMLPWALVAGLRGEVDSPPHAATEVADALLKLLASPGASLDEVLAFLHGPDFPGGGEVGDAAAIRTLYETGEATLRVRATIELELPARLVVSSPFQVEGGLFRRLVEDAVRASRLEGIADLAVQQSGSVLHVGLPRGAGQEALKRARRALADLLPLEQEARFRLPWPLMEGLRAFLDARRAVLSRSRLEMNLMEARVRAGDGGRRTRLI